MVRKLLLGCGIASSLAYVAATVVGALVWPGYNSMSQSVSELSAIGAPSQPFVSPLLAAYTLLVIPFGVGVWLSADGRRSRRVVGALLVGFGVFDEASGLIPHAMHQREALAAGEATTSDTMHLIFASIDVLFIFLIVGFGAFALGRRFRIYSIATFVILLVFGFVAAQDAGRVAANLPTPYNGLEERINIFGYLLWAAVLAIGLLRAERQLPEGGQAEIGSAVGRTSDKHFASIGGVSKSF
jgi:uncharacterized membrane protein